MDFLNISHICLLAITLANCVVSFLLSKKLPDEESTTKKIVMALNITTFAITCVPVYILSGTNRMKYENFTVPIWLFTTYVMTIVNASFMIHISKKVSDEYKKSKDAVIGLSSTSIALTCLLTSYLIFILILE